MSTSNQPRAVELSARFQRLNDDAIALVERCTPEQWAMPSRREQWPLAVLAAHIGETHGAFTWFLEGYAVGEQRSPDASVEDVERDNAEQAETRAAIPREDALELLRTNGQRIVELMAACGDDRLGQVGGNFGGNELTVAQFIEYVVIGHLDEHLASLREMLG